MYASINSMHVVGSIFLSIVRNDWHVCERVSDTLIIVKLGTTVEWFVVFCHDPDVIAQFDAWKKAEDDHASIVKSSEDRIPENA